MMGRTFKRNEHLTISFIFLWNKTKSWKIYTINLGLLFFTCATKAYARYNSNGNANFNWEKCHLLMRLINFVLLTLFTFPEYQATNFKKETLEKYSLVTLAFFLFWKKKLLKEKENCRDKNKWWDSVRLCNQRIRNFWSNKKIANKNHF